MWLLPACGGEDQPEPPDQSSESRAPKQPATRSSDARVRPDSARPQARRAQPRKDAKRAVPTGAGSAYRVPSPPRRASTTPEIRCAVATAPAGRGGTALKLPPAPGLRADRRGPGVVLATYAFRPVSATCAPVRLKLTVDVSQDTLPGAATYVRVAGLRGTVELPIPRDLRGADVIRATSYTEDLRSSSSAAVLID